MVDVEATRRAVRESADMRDLYAWRRRVVKDALAKLAKPAGVNDVADRAKVSATLVSRVLSGEVHSGPGFVRTNVAVTKMTGKTIKQLWLDAEAEEVRAREERIRSTRVAV